ncbi:hypothetical protein E2562_037300 [Oryza meyeriana var. granulata]|uniref:Uncharacterized protein n=1 Tax=Oryza meyeriana var. granulata TaxID=110450 RepID=A0A6G1E8P0_9ORYZ|nr:hypothetical protein E2562_037300 [Oryza meyeriana var. granulata]
MASGAQPHQPAVQQEQPPPAVQQLQQEQPPPAAAAPVAQPAQAQAQHQKPTRVSLSYEEISKLFSLPISEAASILGNPASLSALSLPVQAGSVAGSPSSYASAERELGGLLVLQVFAPAC